MAINKVIRKGTTVLDLTSDTVTPETLMSGVTAHNAAGEAIVGTASSGEDVTDETTAYTNKLASLNTAIIALETELQGKASGGSGGSIETCTLIIEGHSSSLAMITRYIDGNFIVKTALYEDSPSTYENVVCGSGIFFTGSFLDASYTDGSLVYLGGMGVIYQAPQTAGSTATVTLIPD